MVKMSQNQPRIAIITSRNKNNFVYNSCLYEFEDIIAEVDNVDWIYIPNSGEFQKSVQNVVRKTAQYITPLTKVRPPLVPKVTLEREYDLIFYILDFPYSVQNLNLIKQWREKSKIAVCYVIELWQTELAQCKNYLTFLNNFDFVFLGHSQIVEQTQDIIGKPCAYLAPAIDTLRFCPQSLSSDRTIDITSMGRRSEVTHEALLKLTQKGNFFYHYDLFKASEAKINNHQAHRIFNANILKNSRYFITNYAKVNCLEQVKGQIEIGYRFFEGAAAGTVMIGCPPQTEVFQQYFDWKNAVIPMEFDEPNIEKIIKELDEQPELLQQISSDNIKNSLLKHDWLYRWQTVLERAGLSPIEKLEKRKTYLQQLASRFTI